ncbi:MAG TPA: amino acid permease [Steroidobacteraceae bacterium]|nr:amino acid permease [Steroidobacteraceae bacterium]
MSNASGHPDRDPAAGPTELIRGLGCWQATAVVVSTMVGTGVFLVAAPMARAAGSANLVLASWLIGTVIVVCGGLCFAELGAALPEAGGLFVYLSRGLGPLWGFLFGWTNSILAAPARMATLAAGFMRFVGFFFPALGAPLETVHVAHHAFALTAAQLVAAGVVLSLTAFNSLSVRTGGRVQLALGVIKVAVVVALIAAGWRLSRPFTGSDLASATLSVGAIPAVLSALVPVMWAYNGFQNLGHLGGEIRNPGANIPRSLLGGLLLVAALYVLVDLTYFHVLPVARIAVSQDVASDVATALLGASGARWLTLAMALSALASLHAVTMAEARVPYAMARRGLFFFAAARLHPRFHSPVGALLYIGTLAALMALTGTFEELYSIYIFTMWIFFGIAAVALIRLRVSEPQLVRPYRAWGYPWTPMAFCAAALALTLNLWIDSPVRSSLGVLVILAGIPLYRLWRARERAGSPDLQGGARPA